MEFIGVIRIAVAAAALSAPGAALSEGLAVAGADAQYTDTEIGQASWSCAGCGCGDACCGDSCCCGDACGDRVACGGRPCLENCGLLGLGYLTYDPCASGCPLPELLLGSFACPSEGCFDDFISPMTNFVHFEDPRNVTELRGVFLQHRVPSTALGGDINLYAIQIRARLTDRLSLVAAKDGYIVSDNPLIDDGWADVDLGLKYALFRDPASQRLLSAGFSYNLPVGSQRSLQDRGDGIFNLYLTGGSQILGAGHWLSAVGGQLPVDGDANSSFVYWSNHFDYQVRKGWYALTEFNWFHYASDGDNRLGLTGLDGGDLFNLGSGGVEGNDIVTGAYGLKYKPNRKTEIGVAHEVPLTQRRDVLDNRLTVDLILRY